MKKRSFNCCLTCSIYRDFYIAQQSPPIPSRAHDWSWAHVDYDGPGDDRIGTSPSELQAKEAVDQFLADKCDECTDGVAICLFCSGDGCLNCLQTGEVECQHHPLM